MAKQSLEEIFNKDEQDKTALMEQAKKAPIFGKVFDKDKPSLEEYEPGALEQIGQEVIKPFAKITGTILSAGRGLYKFSEAGIRHIVGDKEGAMASVIEAGQPFERDLGFYGKLGKIEPIESPEEAIGAGAQAASYFVGFQEGKVYTDMMKNSGIVNVLRNYWRQIAMREGAAGSIEEMGRAVSGGENDPEEIIKKGVIGGIFGAVAGLTMIPVFEGVRNVFSFIRKGGPQFTKEVLEEAIEEGTEDVARQNPFIKTVLGEDVDISKSSMLENDKKIAQFFNVEEDVVNGRSIITQDVPISSLDEPVQGLINSGIMDNDVNLMMQASEAEINVFTDMMNSAKASQATWRTQKRPVEYVGDAVIDRVKHINDQTTVYTKSLNRIIDGMPSAPVNVTDVYSSFVEGLGKDISIDDAGKLIFDTSRYSGEKSAPIRRMLQETYDLIKPGANGVLELTPQRIRTIRQQLFDTLELGKQQQINLPTSDYIVNGVRKDLHQIMGTLSNEYSNTSLKLAQMIELNREFYQLIGRQWKGEAGELLSLRAGEVMNMVLGNASAKPLNTLGKIELIAKQTGFDDGIEIEKLINFNDGLEDLFGTTQTRSLRGQVGRAERDAMTQATKSLMSPGSPLQKLLQFGGNSIDLITGTRDKDKIDAITNYLDWRIK